MYKMSNFPKLGKIYTIQQSDARFIYREIFEENSYLKHGIEIKKGDFIVDVGANIGLFTLFAYEKCEGNIFLWSIEPIPKIYNTLKKNTILHKINPERVRLINVGITSNKKDKSATFTFYKYVPGNSTLKPEEKQKQIETNSNPSNFMAMRKNNNMLTYILIAIFFTLLFPIRQWIIKKIINFWYTCEKVNCPLLTMENLCKNYSISHIDLLKIDVEGSEYEVLKSFEESYWSNVKQVILETDKSKSEMICNFLKAQGFTNVVCEIPKWAIDTGLENCNVYATKV